MYVNNILKNLYLCCNSYKFFIILPGIIMVEKQRSNSGSSHKHQCKFLFFLLHPNLISSTVKDIIFSQNIQITLIRMSDTEVSFLYKQVSAPCLGQARKFSMNQGLAHAYDILKFLLFLRLAKVWGMTAYLDYFNNIYVILCLKKISKFETVYAYKCYAYKKKEKK